MRLATTCLALLSMFLALPVMAQEPDDPDPLAFFELGPGFFTTVDAEADSLDRSGISTYVGLGFYPASKVALSARLFVIQESERTIASSLWGWLTFGPAGLGKPGIYLSFGAGTDFTIMKFAGRGGYQIALFKDEEGRSPVMGFIEAEGRYVNEEDINAAAQANLGLRANWGHR